MFRGFYTVGSGMIAQQRKTEMLANNMANANTPGFKAEQSSIRSFPEMYMSSMKRRAYRRKMAFNKRLLASRSGFNGRLHARDIAVVHARSMRETGLTTDIALIDGRLPMDAETGKQGAIFFRLENEDGNEHYTKNGNFTLDASGYLDESNGTLCTG